MIMRNTVNRLAAILCLLYLSSPIVAATEYTVPRPFGRVGIVSLLGTTFHGVHQGILVFGNAVYTAEVPAWGIDQDTAVFLTNTLVADGYSASVLKIAPTSADEFYVKKWVPAPNYGRLRQLAADQGYNTLIVVARSSDVHNRLIEPGFGLYALIKAVFPYASIDMQIEDVKTGKRLAYEFNGSTDAYPDKSLTWKDKFDSYSDQERERIRRGIENLVHKELLQILANKHVIRSDQKP